MPVTLGLIWASMIFEREHRGIEQIMCLDMLANHVNVSLVRAV